MFATAIRRRDLVAGAAGVTLAGALGGFLLRRSFSRAPVAYGTCTMAPSAIVERRGFNISFSRQGSGPPLLLLHGAGSSRRVWGPAVEILAERYDVLTPDLPGFGQSPPMGATPNIAGLTDAVASWLRDIGVEGPHVVGNSLGGGIALELGIRDTARSVIGLSPIGFWNAVEYDYLRFIIYATCALVRLPLPGSMGAKAEKLRLFLGLFFAHPEDLLADDVQCTIDDLLHSQVLLDTVDACGSYRVREQQTDIPSWQQCVPVPIELIMRSLDFERRTSSSEAVEPGHTPITRIFTAHGSQCRGQENPHTLPAILRGEVSLRPSPAQ